MSDGFVVKGYISQRDLEDTLKESSLWNRLNFIADLGFDTIEELAEYVAGNKDTHFGGGTDGLPRKVKIEVTFED